jgi:T-complex protein 1 subunit gamma
MHTTLSFESRSLLHLISCKPCLYYIFSINRYFAFLEKCSDAKACTVMLRGGSKDVLNEIERNLQDCMQVVRNVVFDPRMLPGGGATELAIATALSKSVDEVEGISRWPYAAIGNALEVIPRTLAQNCGANVVRLMADLRTKQSAVGGSSWGVNGTTGEVADMHKLGIWEPYVVKTQTLKTAIESACLILRIDDVVSGTRKKK